MIVGEYRYNEMLVAFHCMRENHYCPWETVGVYLSAPAYAKCRYLREHWHMRDIYKREVQRAGVTIAPTKQFLENWRNINLDQHTVITPVIHYWTRSTDPKAILDSLYRHYVTSDAINAFACMAVMLSKKERFFADQLQVTKASGPLKALKEASLI